MKNGPAKLAYMKKRQQRDGDAIRARQRARWHANRERFIARNKEWRLKHRDQIERARRKRHEENPAYNILCVTKARAKRYGLEFDLTFADIKVPNICPVLGIPLRVSKGYATANSPSLDRIDNNKGYIKGNVFVVSFKANTIKSNATPEELKKVAEFYGRL